MSDFQCPICEQEYTIADLELWEVYNEEGKETEFKCTECETDMIIISRVIGWTFEAELEGDL